MVTFWDWVDGRVQGIALTPEEDATFYSGGPTDEGYSHRWTEYRLDGDRVLCRSRYDARDCDGRVTGGDEYFALLSELTADTSHEGPARPLWRRMDSHQRDYSAEAAGY